jgi:hypothetical protein
MYIEILKLLIIQTLICYENVQQLLTIVTDLFNILKINFMLRNSHTLDLQNLLKKLLCIVVGSDSYTWHGNININTRKRTIFIEQMRTYLVFKKVHSLLA